MPKCSMFRAPVKGLRFAYSPETFGRIDAISLWRNLLCPIKIGVRNIVRRTKNQSSIPATILDFVLWCWRNKVSVTTNQRYLINSCFLWGCWGKFYNVVLKVISFVTLTLTCQYTIQIALVSWVNPTVEVYLISPFPPKSLQKNSWRQVGFMQK